MGEKPDKSACLDPLPHQPVWKPCKPRPGCRGIGDGIEIIEAESVHRKNFEWRLALLWEEPGRNRAGSAIDDRFVLRQLLHRLRAAMGFEVGRCGANDHWLARDTTRDQSGPVRQCARADGEIMAIFCKIDEAIVKGEVKL